MNPKIFVSNLADNSHVQTSFLVSSKALRETRNGDAYLTVTLTDRTGSIDAKAWDNVHALAARFEQDDFVTIRGRVSSYRDSLQITLADIEAMDEASVDVSDYLPESKWSRDALFAQVQELIRTEVRSAEMARFLEAFFGNEEFARKYCTAPAAMTNHHNYIGGLIEHSLSMARVGVGLTRHYNRYYPGMLNPDLVIAGCLLHDMGKIEELSYSRSFGYTTHGRLVGHIVGGVEMISKVAAASTPPFDEQMLMQIKHLILSHHGRMEYGSPTLPRTPEAMLLHEIDMIDSRMNMIHLTLSRHQEKVGGDGEGWTDYQRLFEGSMYMTGNGASGWADIVTHPQTELFGPGKLAADDEDDAPQAEHAIDAPPRRVKAAADNDTEKSGTSDTMTLSLFDK